MNRCCLGSAACLVVVLFGPSFAIAQPAPCAPVVSPAPVPSMTVYYCTSKLAGFFPKIGPLCHASVVFCPAGQCPAIFEDGQWVSNPRCISYGTQPFKRGFLRETKQRIGLSCCPVPTPPNVIFQRVSLYDRLWRPLINNCMHAAHWATCW